MAFGKEAGALLGDTSLPLELKRLPAWDRTYYMWLNPSKRWLNDPFFRRWLAGVVDRRELVDYLFDGQGERAFSLSGHWSSPVYELQPDRPLSPMTVPRLELLYDEADPYAKTVAQRIEAVLATNDAELSLLALPGEQIRERLIDGAVEMVLLAHRPATDDPVLALLGTVWWFGKEADEAKQRLRRASGAEQPGERSAGALEAEEMLLRDARLVPLMRLHAWLVRHPLLAGVQPGPDGVLRLEETWWRP